MSAEPQMAGFSLMDFFRRQWLLLPGLAALLLPTLLSLQSKLWALPDQGQGPLILLLVVWLFWRGAQTPPATGHGSLSGMVPLLAGLLLYVFGRSQQIWAFEIGGLLPVVAGLLLLQGGRPLLRHHGFALFFMVFLVPPPGFVVDWMTSDLKTLVSALAENVVYALGYPVSRNGVLLNIGPYQLMVADACSGMNSMFSLSALGVLFLYLRPQRGRWAGALLLASIVPVSIAANVLRVITLMLVTYHLGDAAGQGFLHEFAGILLFIVALLLLYAIDQLLAWAVARRTR
jgi:exosortase B